MQLKHETRMPWREREFVSFTDAGLIVGRSRTWVGNMVTSGGLEACRVTAGPMLITVKSLKALVDGAGPVIHSDLARKPKRRLELVVNND